jgi:hypothetical protein
VGAVAEFIINRSQFLLAAKGESSLFSTTLDGKKAGRCE